MGWCLRAAGIKTAYFGAARSWFDARHIIWQNGVGQTPRTGDVVGYRWGAARISHVGFIDVWGTGPSCQTVEGNTSGGRENRDGDGVFKNWRLKRQVTAVANVIDNPRY